MTEEIMPGVIAGGHCTNHKPWTWAELERAEKIKPKDPTCELSYLDERINMGMQEELEEMWKDAGRPQKPVEEPRHRRSRPMRPYIGCPDCPRWSGRRCTKQFEDTTLCREIEERYMEKGE